MPHLTFAQNLHYGHRHARGSCFDLAQIADMLDLSLLLARYPASLSGGQKQRVALGRAIACHPALLLLEEPVSALDEALRTSIVEYMGRAVREFAVPTVVITHDQALVEALGAQRVDLVPP